jgi:dTDP-4-dehydrorhamnose reductase
MIIGSGLMARVFAGPATAGPRIVVHAAGVSNSQCQDAREYLRDRTLLERSLAEAENAGCFVYFSTCSVFDPASADTAYVRHKLDMEHRVRQHPAHLIFRLPQVAGRTPNPHTLLNYLYARIMRGERFAIWRYSRRNIIDCDDVRVLGLAIIESGLRAATLNIASPESYAVTEIVTTMERIVGGHAVFDLLERGTAYPIDVTETRDLWQRCGVRFGGDYLERVVRKYYDARS